MSGPTKEELVEENNRLANEIAALKSRPAVATLDDAMVDRIGGLYPDCEREARLLGRDEQVMLSAVALAGLRVVAEDGGEDISLDALVSYVKRVREPFMPETANPQPTPGNPR